MIFNAEGRLTQIGAVEQVTGRDGRSWDKCQIVVEVPAGQNAVEDIAITAFGQVVGDLAEFAPGDKVRVAFSLRSREWNGRYYTDVDLFRIEAAAARQSAPRQQAAAPAPAPASGNQGDNPDDIPF